MQNHNRHLSSFSLLLGLFLTLMGCGLFYRGTPNSGEFCDVMTKPPICIQVDMKEKTLTIDGTSVAMAPIHRLSYNFSHPTENYPGVLNFSAEHRVELVNTATSEKRFYLRKKKPRF